MFDSIFSTFWGDSASYISIIGHAIPESVTTIVAVILRNYTDGVFIFNVQILLGFLLTFVLSYYVGIKIFNNKFSALFLALVLTFAPLRIRYSLEWAVLTFWGYYILFFYSIYKFIKSGSKKWLLLAGITFCLSFTEQPYLGVILTFISGISTLIFVAIQKSKTYFKRLVILYAVLVLFGVPGIYNVYKTRYLNETLPSVNFSMAARGESDRWAYSARPWNYLIPDINNPILGDFAVKANYWIWEHPPFYLTEPFFPKDHTLYLGFTLLLLSASTLYLTYIKPRKFFIDHKSQTLYILIFTITAFIFSMPPYINFHNIYIYFPSQFLYGVLPQFRSYARFGAIVFIGVALLSTTALSYLLQSEIKKSLKYSLLAIILILVSVEFSTPYFTNTISSEPTPPYKWLTQQSGSFSYLEVPRRADYTDLIYNQSPNIKTLNSYLQTPKNISEIEDSITSDIGDSKDLICNRFANQLNGKYIMYHDEGVYKENVVEEFQKTGQVTPQLKIALEESWGEPIWGNHVPKSEEDLLKIANRKNLLQKLKSDPRFKVIEEFKRMPPANGKSYTIKNLDEVTIFELNPDYCD